MPSDQRSILIEDLFRQYGRGVGSYILARVGNPDIAETITSNVFMIVVRRIEQCKRSPAAWLWSIVRSELARYFRQHRPTEPLDESYRDPAPAPPEVVAKKEMRERMRHAVARLGEDQQRIVYLKFFLDIPNGQIAEELGLSASNVGVIVHRATKRLRELMEEMPADAPKHSERSSKDVQSLGEPGGPPPGVFPARGRAGSPWHERP